VIAGVGVAPDVAWGRELVWMDEKKPDQGKGRVARRGKDGPLTQVSGPKSQVPARAKSGSARSASAKVVSVEWRILIVEIFDGNYRLRGIHNLWKGAIFMPYIPKVSMLAANKHDRYPPSRGRIAQAPRLRRQQNTS
jgi:hypothetical protein